MSNLFETVLNDAEGVQEELLGPTYPYYKNIKMPNQIGMSDEGSMQALGNDVNGLIQYVEVLVTGNSEASATGGPLGNKFFLQTGAKCKDVASGNQVNRYIYIDNVPNGDIPFISQGLGVNFSNFEGLIPGAMGNLNVLNPFAIMSSFLAGATPDCQELTMQTIDINNNSSTQTQYVTLADIGNMNACTFQNGTNPVNGSTCNETFQTGVSANAGKAASMPEDPLAQLYFASLAAIGIYILYRFMDKSK
jgi:hypothetical protein